MKQILKLSFAATVLILAGGCKKFIDVNSNPNSAVNTNSKYVLTGALNNTYRNQVGANLMMVPGAWTGMHGHSTSFTGGADVKTYEYTSSSFNVFDPLFDNIADYQYIINNAAKDGVAFMKDLADIMQCYVYQELVDVYGNVPYTEVGKGVANIQPAYTDQKTIYESLVTRLDAAQTAIKAATWPVDATITSQDIFFQGNKDKWIRFANTLKLRILMRQSFMTGRDTYITTAIATTKDNGYIQENVLCQPNYQQASGKLNPYYANYGFNELNTIASNHQYYKMGAVMINWLKTGNTTNALPQSTGSPTPTANADTFRLQALSWPSGTTVTTDNANLSTYVGIPLGAGGGFATGSSSPIGKFQIQQGQGTRAAMVMLQAEALLLQAEAAQRYGTTFPGYTTAKALYEAGVTAHFRACAAPSTAAGSTAGDPFAARYLARAVNNQGWDASTDKIRAILIQKWISLQNVNGLEAWSEYRKSSGSASVGVPSLVKTLASTTNPEPVRFLYPQSELDVNKDNVPTGISRFTSKIFWDVN
jgi:hypothetical protein